MAALPEAGVASPQNVSASPSAPRLNASADASPAVICGSP